MENKITEEKVISGLNYIISNKNTSYEKIKYGLLEIGCDFTLEDQKREFPNEEGTIQEGILNGSLSCGANIIINVINDEFGYIYVKDRLLNPNSEVSIYTLLNKIIENKQKQAEDNNSGMKL